MTTQSLSQVIVIYLFLQFSKPQGVKTEDGDSDPDEDQRRDVNLEMLYYINTMPKMRRIKDVDYKVDKYNTAQEYLFEERGLDGTYRIPDFNIAKDDYEAEETNMENFVNERKKHWGEGESSLRTAIYVSFVRNTDTVQFRKEIKRRRSTFRMSGTSNILTSFPSSVSINSKNSDRKTGNGWEQRESNCLDQNFELNDE